MTLLGPNLASRPFVNERPVRRLSILIWLLAVLLLAINVFLYQRHLSGQHANRAASSSLEASIATEDAAIAELERRLDGLDLEAQNEVVHFLNSEIARRTFSWSRLFDNLEDVLPPRVEVRRIAPRVVQQRRADKGDQGPRSDWMNIDISGYAPSSEELLRLVDNLFEHPNFVTPNLQSESERDDHRLLFALSVLYLPDDIEAEEPDPAASRFDDAALTDSVAEGDEP